MARRPGVAEKRARRDLSAAPDEAHWEWRWKAGRAEPAPKIALCPLLYGKTWAYSVEIDDGPASTRTVSLPLLASFATTDAPPGVRGGKLLPLTGGAAVFPLRLGGGNAAYLEGDDLRALERAGWATLNHGYAHRGNSWEPTGALTPAQLREELFWSQVVLAAESDSGRSPAHFVYPNGYMAYQTHLKEFGLRTASRVGGKRASLLAALPEPLDLDRNYLDESVWSKSPDPLLGLPRAPRSGDWAIDFTHGMDADPMSPNGRRWRERLRFVTANDDVWCAPTPVVAAYLRARLAARLETESGRVRLSLPTGEASRLTLRWENVSETALRALPPGCVVHRRGEVAWVTTPSLGLSGVAPPARLERVYRGPVADVRFSRPARVAGVRVLQRGETKPGFRFALALKNATGLQPLTDAPLEPGWGVWRLFPLLPNAPAARSQGLTATADPALVALEVWALA